LSAGSNSMSLPAIAEVPMKPAILAILALLLIGPCVKADTVGDLASYLTANSVLSLGPGVADELAGNILYAQATTPYAALESDSLSLSIESVLRAISIEVFPGGPTEILDATDTPIPFLQSTIAIDDRVSLTLSFNGVIIQPGDVLDFGSVPLGSSSSSPTLIMTTPEPSTIFMLAFALCLLSLWRCRPGVTKVKV
jgi:hypothetical protein